MNNTPFGGMGQSSGNLDHVPDALPGWERPTAVDKSPEGHSFDELECDEVEALVFSAEIRASDVLVIQLGRRTGLLLESRHILGISGRFGRQDLEGDHPSEIQVAGLEHRCHPTGPNRLDQLKVTELSSGQGWGVTHDIRGGWDSGGGRGSRWGCGSRVLGDDSGSVVGVGWVWGRS
jgi:hypothetical protein